MARHEDYGRLDAATDTVTYAPPMLTVTETCADGRVRHVLKGEAALTDADYLAQGWKRVKDEPPAPSEDGKEVYPAGWYEDETEIVRKYDERGAAPKSRPIPRTFSKLKIYGAIAQMGVWEQVKAWLEGKTVDGMSAWTAFMLAQEVSESHALFAPLAEEARLLIGLSEGAFEKMLDGCVLEGD